MKRGSLVLMMALMSASVALADSSCPPLKGTYVCDADSAPFYVDISQYHQDSNTCSGGYCFDVFLMYYKFSSKNVEDSKVDSDPVMSLAMITNPAGSKDINYWTIPDFREAKDRAENENARASLQMHSQATCFQGHSGASTFQENGIKVNLTGEKILRVERESADFKYREIRYVALDPNDSGKLVVVHKEAERSSPSEKYGKEGAPSIQICQRIPDDSVNSEFAKKKKGGWKAFAASINLLGPKSDGTYGRPEDTLDFGLKADQSAPHAAVVSKVEGVYNSKSKNVQIKISKPDGNPVAKNYQLPGGPSMTNFMNFLKELGFN